MPLFLVLLFQMDNKISLVYILLNFKKTEADLLWDHNRYKLKDRKTWTADKIIYYNTILQLELFCCRAEKMVWDPLSQAYFALWDKPDLCQLYKVDQDLLATINLNICISFSLG